MKNYKRVFCLFLFLISCISATTHWMVTENGLIHPKLESQFEMENPSDLLAFMNQDTRWNNIINMYYDLSKRTATIHHLWYRLESETEISTYIDNDKNCVKARPLSSLDWYNSFDDGKLRDIEDKDILIYTPECKEVAIEIPDCKEIYPLTFSMFTFEHLEAMANRQNLSTKPEESITKTLSPTLTLDQFGHWLVTKLHENNTSWLHYNLATLYWRAKGNMTNALECSRRAVLHVPRYYRDIALLSLGVILNRSAKTDDAILVLHGALNLNNEYPVNYFVLANAYAIKGDFNKSVELYDKALKINPKYELARKHKHAVLCHHMILQTMDNVKRLINSLKQELVEFTEKEMYWLKSQAAFLYTMRQTEENADYKSMAKNSERMTNLTGLEISQLQKECLKNALIQYYLEEHIHKMNLFKDRGIGVLQEALSLQKFLSTIKASGELSSIYVAVERPDNLQMEPGEIKKEIGPFPEIPDLAMKKEKRPLKDKVKESLRNSLMKEFEALRESEQSIKHQTYIDAGVLFPPTLIVNRNREDFDTIDDWPSQQYCAERQDRFPKNLNLIYPVFMPFENKGIRLGGILSDAIGVPVGVEHELPWHPPVCPRDKDAFNLKKNVKQQLHVEVAPAEYLRIQLLEYVSGGSAQEVESMQDAEVGQRILSALNKNFGPKWILYTLSSLYWRVRYNKVNAINCLIAASKSVPNSLRDIVWTSLASLYLELGLPDDALEAAEQSFRINLYEPATNLILAQWNMLRHHRNTQIFHLKQIIRIQPDYMGGIPRDVLEAWECLLPASTSPVEVPAAGPQELQSDDICNQMEPGLGVLCNEAAGECHVANLRCVKKDNGKGGSTLVRVLELQKDDATKDKKGKNDRQYGNPTYFDEILKNMPQNSNDMQGHAKNYRAMRRIVEKLSVNCGGNGCDQYISEQYGMLTEDDCNHQHMELGYWVHMIAYKDMFMDFEPRLASEILRQKPSSRKTPECPEVDTSKHFITDRLKDIDISDWDEPNLILMHQFAETYDLFDYVKLGSKVASYLEASGGSSSALCVALWWCGGVGRGACARRCALAALPAARAAAALVALLHAHEKHEDAKEVAYLLLYQSPKNKFAAFLAAIMHSYLNENEAAIWLLRYALNLDKNFRAAKECLQAMVCRMTFGQNERKQTDLLSELESLKMLKEYGKFSPDSYA